MAMVPSYAAKLYAGHSDQSRKKVGVFGIQKAQHFEARLAFSSAMEGVCSAQFRHETATVMRAT
jgi:hypothetical protein